jgi:uncharacterized protein (DUF2062 family)
MSKMDQIEGTGGWFNTFEMVKAIRCTWRIGMELIPDRIFFNSLCKGAEQVRSLFWQELKELRNPTHSAGGLAAAFALGTLLSFIPVPLLDSMLVGMVLARFKQVNRAALLMARLIWNDLLVFPLYGPGYRLGSAVLAPVMAADGDLAGMGTVVAPLLSFTVGSIIIATGVAAAGYVLFLLGIQLYRLGAVAGSGR